MGNFKYAVTLMLIVGICPVTSSSDTCYTHSPARPTGTSGTILYDGSDSRAKCEWVLPLESRGNYVIILTLVVIEMSFTNTKLVCTGDLTLPDTGRKCVWRTPACFVYATPGSHCNIERALASYPKCPRTVWHASESRIAVKMDAIDRDIVDYRNTFTLHYNITDCRPNGTECKGTETVEPTPAYATITSNGSNTVQDGGSSHQGFTDSECTSSARVIIAVLGCLLLLAWVAILLLALRIKAAGVASSRIARMVQRGNSVKLVNENQSTQPGLDGEHTDAYARVRPNQPGRQDTGYDTLHDETNPSSSREAASPIYTVIKR